MQPSFNFLILLIPLCVAVPIFLVGAGLLYYALNNRRKAAASTAWSQANGRVLDARIQQHVHHGEHGVHHTYEPVIEYEYTVLGTPYRGSRLAFGATGGARKSAEEALARYAPGTTITVYYDPQNPSEAVLERQSKGGTLAIVVGSIFMVVGLLFGCVGGVIVLFVLAASQAG